MSNYAEGGEQAVRHAVANARLSGVDLPVDHVGVLGEVDRGEVSADGAVRSVVDSELRDQLQRTLEEQPSEFIHPDEFGEGYDVDYPAFVAIADSVYAPALRQAYLSGHDAGYAAANVGDSWADKPEGDLADQIASAGIAKFRDYTGTPTGQNMWNVDEPYGECRPECDCGDHQGPRSCGCHVTGQAAREWIRQSDSELGELRAEIDRLNGELKREQQIKTEVLDTSNLALQSLEGERDAWIAIVLDVARLLGTAVRPNGLDRDVIFKALHGLKRQDERLHNDIAAASTALAAIADRKVWEYPPSLGDRIELVASELKIARQEGDYLLWLHAEAKHKLELPCGSCHPCMNWADETWRRADRKPPHVHEWDDAVAELKRLRYNAVVLPDNWRTFLASVMYDRRDFDTFEAYIDNQCGRASTPNDQPDACPHGDTNCSTVLGEPYHGNCHPWHYHFRARLNGVHGALVGQGNELAGELHAAIGFLDSYTGECKETPVGLHSGGEIESQHAVGVGSQPDSEPRAWRDTEAEK